MYVGDGALRPTIEALARERDIPGVVVTGFVNQSRIPEMYACGDIFVLPSLREPWGLSVNEAMAAGLPIIASDRVGCAADLIADGVNGYVVRHDDEKQLAQRMESLVIAARMRGEFGKRSREAIDGWSVQKTANGILAAARGD